MARRPRRASGLTLALTLAIAAAGVLSIPSSGEAQQGVTVDIAGLDAEHWPQGQAIVSVIDAAGRPVAGLTEADFTAELSGSPLPVVEISQAVDSSLPVSVVLALDVSGSMEGGAIEEARNAARVFLGSLGDGDRVAVVTFSDTVRTVRPFTTDRADIDSAIDGLEAGGATALYDATLHSLRLASEASGGRRAVVFLSDGLDHGSAVPRDDALAAANTLGVPTFVIGLGDELDRAFLQELADTTGGRFAETPSPEGLNDLYQQVGESLRGQYVLALDGAAVATGDTRPGTLRVTATAGGAAVTDEREVCLAPVCATMTGIADGERVETAREIEANVLSTQPVRAVTLLINGEEAGAATEPPYRFTFDPAALEDGTHEIALSVATDDGAVTLGETSVRLGPPPPGVLDGEVPLYAAGAGGAIVVLLIAFIIVRRRRRSGEAPAPDAGPPAPEPEPEPPAPVRAPVPEKPRALWTPDEERPAPPEPAPQPVGRLRAIDGPLMGETYDVGYAPISLGTGHRCRIKLEDPTGDEISAEHVRAWVRDRQLMLHELRRLSALGPVGGRWAILAPGDDFNIGPYRFRFELLEEGGAEEVPNILRTPQAADAAPAPPPSATPEPLAGTPPQETQEGPQAGTSPQTPETLPADDASPAPPERQEGSAA